MMGFKCGTYLEFRDPLAVPVRHLVPLHKELPLTHVNVLQDTNQIPCPVHKKGPTESRDKLCV